MGSALFTGDDIEQNSQLFELYERLTNTDVLQIIKSSTVIVLFKERLEQVEKREGVFKNVREQTASKLKEIYSYFINFRTVDGKP